MLCFYLCLGVKNYRALVTSGYLAPSSHRKCISCHLYCCHLQMRVWSLPSKKSFVSKISQAKLFLYVLWMTGWLMQVAQSMELLTTKGHLVGKKSPLSRLGAFSEDWASLEFVDCTGFLPVSAGTSWQSKLWLPLGFHHCTWNPAS